MSASGHASKGKMIRCEDCGTVIASAHWRAGMACTACGGHRMVRLMGPRGSADFLAADRHGGPADADKRFGQLARWAGMVRINQVVHCMAKQREHARGHETVPHIGDVMLQEGFLSKAQVRAVLKAISVDPEDADERDFASRLRRDAGIPRQAIERCVGAQRESVTAGHQAPPLANLVIERKVASDQHVAAVLKAQRKEGRGLLAVMARAVAEKEGEEDLGRVAGWRGSPVVGALAAVLILAGAALIYSVLRTEGSAPTAQLYCVECKRLVRRAVRVREEGAPPMVCKGCGRSALRVARQCRKCWTLFGESPKAAPVKCPRCGSDDVGPVAAPEKASNKR
jgi:DNA-directed RNA polymerase subunit RPC12/RpoP